MSKNNADDSALMSFWDHLDVLRGCIVRCFFIVLLFAVVAFVFKNQVFEIILAPQNNDFVIYRCINVLSSFLGLDLNESFNVQLINTGLAQQFLIHMKVSFVIGFLCASPYIVYSLFKFISPALYENEKKYSSKFVVFSFFLFFAGVLVSYFVVFPFTFRFLGTYQVSESVSNMISLESYISTLVLLSLCMGILFEMPVLAWILGKMNLISSDLMTKYRRHAIVIILVLAAIITPTSDVFTLSLVFFPIYLLYELSLVIVRRVQFKKKKNR